MYENRYEKVIGRAIFNDSDVQKTATLGEAKRMPIEQQLEVMEKNLAWLRERITVLEQRLSPVTRPIAISNDSEETERMNGSPLASTLDRYNKTITSCAASLGYLSDALEL
jgi:phage shock protein A